MGELTQFKQFAVGGGRQNPVEGPTLASAATIAPTHRRHVVSGTTAIVNITLPYPDFEGEIVLFPSGIWTWTAAGNIATAGTVTAANSAVTFYYSQRSAKWIPSRLA